MHLEDLQWDWPSRPTNEARFAQMMLSLDGYLAVSGYEPHHRAWTAQQLVQRVFSFQAAVGGSLTRAHDQEVPWDGGYFLQRIDQWYRSAYRTRYYYSGHMFAACALRGTIWVLDVPEIHGDVLLVADADLSRGRDHSPVWNVLNSIAGAGPEITLGLTDYEHWYLLELAQLASTALMSFSTVHSSPLRDEGRGDYILSVQALASGTSYNSARWLNAQCAEKLIKSVLNRLNVRYQGLNFRHSIPKYCELLAQSDPSFVLPLMYAEQIDCSAGVRYGEEGETRSIDALVSHHALLHLLVALGRRGQTSGAHREGTWRQV